MTGGRQLLGSSDLTRWRPLTLLEQPVIAQRLQIVHAVERYCSPTHAALFAEPNLLRGTVRWYTDLPEPLKRLDDGDPAWQRVETLLAEIAALAERLKAERQSADQALGELLELALQGVGPANICWVGEQPVMINWGLLAVGADIGKGVPVSWAGRLRAKALQAPPELVAPQPSQPASPVPPPPGPPETLALGRRAPVWRWAAPVVAALVVVALVAWLLPRALAPVLVWLRLPGAEICRLPVDQRVAADGLATLVSEEVQLRQTLADVRARLAQKKSQCLAVTTPDIDARSVRERAEAGAIEVWLAWDSEADLDLYVQCPDGGLINYQQQRHCGGRLDVDMNCSESNCRHSDHPLEHVFWPIGQAPSGQYRILVSNFDGGPATPFRVRFKVKEQIQDVDGGLSTSKAPVFVTGFTVP